MKIELTGHEAQSLMQLLDIATRAQGLTVAMAALVLAERIKKAAEAEAVANVEPPKPDLHAVS